MKGLHLHVDCASGAAGDMLLGALIDLGVPVEVIGDALDAVGAGRKRLHVARVVRGGVAATDVTVDTTPDGEHGGHGHGHGHEEHAGHGHGHGHEEHAGHGHGHGHEEHAGHGHGHGHGHEERGGHGHGEAEHAGHAHHHYAEIRARIAGAAFAPGVRERALDIFDRLARAEAKLHGMRVEDVAFHEVGAIDSIVDVVGTAAGLAFLAPVAVTCSEIAMGSGTLRCAHGVMPVPAPAALEVLRECGGVMTDGGLARELCTPTGAAILAHAVTAWGPAPRGRARAIGWGAGDVNLADRANVLRVTAVEPAPSADTSADTGADTGAVWQLDANVDDMSPELCAPALDAVFAAGALDAWWTPITMKKGRPALGLSALAAGEAARDAVIAAILRETTTIGVRFAPRDRVVLARHAVEVATRFGAIPIKVATDTGGAVRNAAPEYEACAAAATRAGVPVKLVFAAALAAYDAEGAR